MRHLRIAIQQQQLFLYEKTRCLKTYAVSTAINGAGEQMHSECTPRGWHCVAAKIGDGMPLNGVFLHRQATKDIYHAALARQYPGKDWILTRILRLAGLEANKNLYGKVDSYQRYIYIHGTAAEEKIGQPASRGCVRMRNDDIIELYDQMDVGSLVYLY